MQILGSERREKKECSNPEWNLFTSIWSLYFFSPLDRMASYSPAKRYFGLRFISQVLQLILMIDVSTRIGHFYIHDWTTGLLVFITISSLLSFICIFWKWRIIFAIILFLFFCDDTCDSNFYALSRPLPLFWNIHTLLHSHLSNLQCNLSYLSRVFIVSTHFCIFWFTLCDDLLFCHGTRLVCFLLTYTFFSIFFCLTFLLQFCPTDSGCSHIIHGGWNFHQGWLRYDNKVNDNTQNRTNHPLSEDRMIMRWTKLVPAARTMQSIQIHKNC